MIEEQIKQNALKAEKEHGNFNYQYQGEAFNKGYIAGAHSRDEEIDKLKKLYEEALHKYYESECKLCNPWISVEERLPAKYELVLVKTSRKKYYLADKDSISQPQDEFAIPQLSSYVNGVTHWMPIPQINKEE